MMKSLYLPPWLSLKYRDRNHNLQVLCQESKEKLELLLVTRPLPRDGGMAEDHGAPEAGQLSKVWTRGCSGTESRQRVSGTKSPQLDSAE